MTDIPRELPRECGISAPNMECYQTAKMFHEQLLARHAAITAQHPDPGSIPHIIASMELRRLSRAIQVFAGLTAEACLNMYGMLALGEEKFYGGPERKSFAQKLKLIMALAREAPIAPESELKELGHRLIDMRNRIAHPKPREWTSEHAGEDASNTEMDMRDAARAISDVERFAHLLGTRDRNYYPYFMLF